MNNNFDEVPSVAISKFQWDKLNADLKRAESELSALRAAQPLTREGIDAVITETMEEFITDAKEPLSTWEIHLARVGMNFLRDALLDSLADGETK